MLPPIGTWVAHRATLVVMLDRLSTALILFLTFILVQMLLDVVQILQGEALFSPIQVSPDLLDGDCQLHKCLGLLMKKTIQLISVFMKSHRPIRHWWCFCKMSEDLFKNIRHIADIGKSTAVRETNARPVANASAFWAGRVENWPGQVEFCIEHIRNICLRASAPKI